MDQGAGTRGIEVTRAVGGVPAQWAGWFRVVGTALLLACCGLAMAVTFGGERESSLAQLEADVRAGETQTVEVHGSSVVGGRGYAVVDVVWRAGATLRHTQVVESVGGAGTRASERDGVSGLVTGDVESHLAEVSPGIEVDRTDYRSGWSIDDLFGWQLHGWVVPAIMVVGFASLLLLVSGPQPWRATKWAWFWLFVSAAAPVVIMLFLIIGGPTRLSREPRPDARRLTGGWAFGLSLLLNAVIRSQS